MFEKKKTAVGHMLTVPQVTPNLVMKICYQISNGQQGLPWELQGQYK